MPAPHFVCQKHVGLAHVPHQPLLCTPARRNRRLELCQGSNASPLIAAAAVAMSSNLMDDGISMHPDAVRRRQEAEDRRQKRALETAAARTNSWWEAKGPDNMVFAISTEMFDDIIQHGKTASQLVVVKFFAPWCQACKALYPKFIQIAEHNPDVTFVKVNAADETMRAMAAGMGVTKLPYFHMYTHGQLAKNFTANLHKVSYLRRAISDCKECLTPGCHQSTPSETFPLN